MTFVGLDISLRDNTAKRKHFREVLIHYFLLNKSASETCRLLRELYGDISPSKTTCYRWFQQFRNNNFDANERAPNKEFKDSELQDLMAKYPTLTHAQLGKKLGISHQAVSARLRVMGKKLIKVKKEEPSDTEPYDSSFCVIPLLIKIKLQNMKAEHEDNNDNEKI